MAAYLSLRLIILLFAILPWCSLYPISRFFAFLLRTVIRYRHKMLLNNLKLSFPQYGEKEIRQLHRSVYRQYTEVLCENLKAISIDPNKTEERVEFENFEAIKEYLNNGQNCIALTSHFANWEWQAAAGKYLNHQMIGVYKKSHNRHVEHLLQQYRQRWKVQFTPISVFPRFILKHLNNQNQSTPQLIFLLCDQNPTREQPSAEIHFLNRKTRFILAPEKLAKRYNLPVFHMKMIRIKRGHYRVTANQYSDNNTNQKTQSITQWYAEELEKQILENPASWLWLHNRWKKR